MRHGNPAKITRWLKKAGEGGARLLLIGKGNIRSDRVRTEESIRDNGRAGMEGKRQEGAGGKSIREVKKAGLA